MTSRVVALIINRNRYLITKHSTGEFKDKWEFPGSPVGGGASEFEAIRKGIKETLSLEIFPYITLGTITTNSTSGRSILTLVKCAVSKESKMRIDASVPSTYRWISSSSIARIPFTPAGDEILSHLTKGRVIVLCRLSINRGDLLC